MRVVLVDFRFTYAIVLSLLWVSSSVIGRSNAASSLLNDPFYGISPQDENYYKTSSNTIKCKDGSKKFAKTQLNDDYCDCPDGTDEPAFEMWVIGTSACPNGKFYCQNAGHSPLMIFSSKVNDGICDCCDGSDEYDGKVKCPNTCWEAGKVARDKLKKKIATYQEGVLLRKKEIEQAKQNLVKDEAELSNLKNEEKILKGLVQQLKERKEQIEKAEEKERLQREKEEKERKEAEENERKEKSESGEKAMQEKNKAEENAYSDDKPDDVRHDDKVGVLEEESFDQGKAENVDEEPATEAKQIGTSQNLGTPVNGVEQHATEEMEQSASSRSKDGSSTVPETSSDAESQMPPEAEKKEEKNLENGVSENTEELSREELGRLVASRWTGEKTEKQSGEGGAIANDDQGEDVPEYNHDDEEDRYATDTDDDSERYDTEKYDDNDVEDDIDEPYREEDHDYTSTSYKTDVDDDLDMSEMTTPSSPSWLEKIQQTVRNILQAVNLFQTPVDKSDAARVRKEYDESSDKLSKIQSRISSLTQKLKHEFGMFTKSVRTKKLPKRRATQRLVWGAGTNSRTHTTSCYFQMVISVGMGLIEVRLRCGLKNEVTDVDEPSRCEYVALLYTPAVCSEEKLQELQHKLDELNKKQPQHHDEL
ncbi:glucosidase 2 subunit beta [Citrus sinensis]|uniref:Glucosidase 2 subunit beta n=1 Tax=Citrus sinensis TaxID=2711 RepID=A0ACB8MTP0_CITSI|nr:glucosidase 2 subunit beta [Citrus sinensis]